MPAATFDSPQGRLAFTDEGAGEALLLLHAFPLSRRMWQAQVDALAGTCRCLALDFAGFGDSSSAGEVSRMEDLAAQAMALLDHLHLDQAVVCGLSMGGYAALALAEAAPERLRALILADTRAGADSPEGRRGRLEAAERVLREGPGFLVESLPEKLLGPTSRERRPEVVAWVREQIGAAAPQAVAAAQRGMAARPDRSAVLPHLHVPALVLVGEEDALTPPAESRALAAALLDARLEILPHAGHLSNLETPAAFTSAVGDFLRRLA